MAACLRFAFLLLLAVPALARAADLGSWDPSTLYREGISARELIGAPVRAQDGKPLGEVRDIRLDRYDNIDRLLVELRGGAPGMRRHVAVPWDKLKFAEHLAFVQVSEGDLERGAYSLPTERTGTPPPAAQREWRANELLGDYASLEDAPRYGLVSDLIFDQNGRARGIVVERASGETFAYPYTGVRPGAGAYALPYRAADALRQPQFDSARLDAQSRYAGRLSGNASAGATTDERPAPGR
jgi:sporulation protein YlmC with PRC-barrel domain